MRNRFDWFMVHIFAYVIFFGLLALVVCLAGACIRKALEVGI